MTKCGALFGGSREGMGHENKKAERLGGLRTEVSTRRAAPRAQTLTVPAIPTSFFSLCLCDSVALPCCG